VQRFLSQGFIRAVVCLLFLSLIPRVHADVGLILSDATSEGMSKWTNAGHSSVYLSNICPASPVKLRLCRPDEPGSVLSNYITFGENEDYEWNVVPANIFFYGVEDDSDQPLYASAKLRNVLQDRFRAAYLAELCSGPPCSTNPRAHWRDLVGESFVRGMYVFVVNTTLEQDLRLIAKFNSAPNRSRYNGFTWNCADFAMQVINTYFPHAARPDHLNDFGMTSPKAISKSFTHYAVKHKQLQLRILRIPQIPGEYKISKDCRKGSEVAFRSKRWLFPMLLKSHELVLLATSYYLTGRFNPQKELERHPSLAVAKLDEEIEVAQQQRDLPAVVSLKAKRVELRSAVLGNSADWSQYKQSLREIAASDAGSGVPPDFLREPGTTSASVDEQGRSWLEVSLTGQTRTVGASISAVNADSSDPKLAFRFMLNRVQSQLQTSARNREAIPQFRRDWQLMLAARKGLEQALAETRETGSLSPVLSGHNQP
jgi:hypothetical protein